MKPHQIISLMTFPGTDNTFAMADHDDHIHVGFHPLYGQNTQGVQRQIDAVLKPDQWIKLIDRLGEIDNPDRRRRRRATRSRSSSAPPAPTRRVGLSARRCAHRSSTTSRSASPTWSRAAASTRARSSRSGRWRSSYGERGLELAIGPEGSEDLGLAEGEPPTPVHIAFLALDPETVDAFHAAALEAGGRDNGAPGRGRSTTSATTRPTSSIPTATTSRPSATPVRPPPSRTPPGPADQRSTVCSISAP